MTAPPYSVIRFLSKRPTTNLLPPHPSLPPAPSTVSFLLSVSTATYDVINITNTFNNPKSEPSNRLSVLSKNLIRRLSLTHSRWE
ncbi:hypothetical protein L2E82_40811 [Cichorium intybus]|uniref:Uncharacterized protein n=1 Tax=Cichorium intybus TaxID=13427 RepID=A0ACB9ARE4_CICIN|nr:hypothetical protein L2E82_40811 [Cichorium intybus]